MAITTPTSKLVGSNLNNLGTYDSAVVVLTAGRWYTLTLHGYKTTPAGTVTSVTHDPLGTALSFVLITDGTTSARKTSWDATDHRDVEVWAVKPGSTTASALIRMIWSATQSASGWTLTEWSAGIDPTTQWVKVVVNNGAAGTASSATMNTFGATDNATFFVTALGTGTADPAENIVVNESRVELHEVDDGERAQHADHYQNPNGGDTTLTASWTAAEDWAAIGIEVKSEVVAGAFVRPKLVVARQAVPRGSVW